MVVLVDASAGGYDPALGWWTDSREAVSVVPTAMPDEVETEAYDDDHLSSAPLVSLREHLADVAAEVEALTESLSLDDEAARLLRIAAQWPDLAKARPCFQQSLLVSLPEDGRHVETGPWAMACSIHAASCSMSMVGCGSSESSTMASWHSRAQSRYCASPVT